MNLYDSFPQVTGPEWRMDIYRAGDQVQEIFFDLMSPVSLPEFRGEFGLFHLFEMAADDVLGQIRRQYFSAEFETPIYMLSRKFFIELSFFFILKIEKKFYFAKVFYKQFV
jgi:hypothetical protein